MLATLDDFAAYARVVTGPWEHDHILSLDDSGFTSKGLSNLNIEDQTVIYIYDLQNRSLNRFSKFKGRC